MKIAILHKMLIKLGGAEKVVEKFENTDFNHKKIREHSKNFSKEKFQEQLLKFVEEKYREIKNIQN